jgi:hypothetical protein
MSLVNNLTIYELYMTSVGDTNQMRIWYKSNCPRLLTKSNTFKDIKTLVLINSS